ncbi:MAG: alkaline protease secretion protein AprF [Nitrospirae bacterium]|nr:alkaline protease secretion protein AprF [Nitrospirota bacterium]
MNYTKKKLYVRTGVSCITTFLLVMTFFALLISTAHSETLTLPAGLKLVNENSRLIKITGHEEKISEADTLIAKSRTLPEINAGWGYTALADQPTVIFGPQTVPVSERNFLFYSLNVQQTLYDFQKSASKYEASKKMLNAKKIDTERVRNLVAIDFVLVYLDLLEAENLLKVSEKEVERLESHLRDAKSLYEEGVITKNDLLQAEVKISDAKQRLLTVRNLRAVTASRLNSILVRPLTADMQVEEIREASPRFVEMDREKAWEIAEQQRPEVKIVEETLKALELERTAKKAEYYPKFFLKGGYDYTENRYQVHEGNWALTLGMGINLFQGGATRAELMKIDSQRLKLIEEKNRLMDDIRLEVERYLLDLKTARERVDVTKDAAQQAEENLRINRVKYEEGAGTATDVLDAVTLLTVAETNNYKSVYDLKKAEAAVLYAIGAELSEVYK